MPMWFQPDITCCFWSIKLVCRQSPISCACSETSGGDMKPNLCNRKPRLTWIILTTLACCGMSLAGDSYTLVEIKGTANNSSLGRYADNVSGIVVGSSGLTHGSDT